MRFNCFYDSIKPSLANVSLLQSFKTLDFAIRKHKFSDCFRGQGGATLAENEFSGAPKFVYIV